ncbi:Hsp70 family protein [Dactylosporangium sucinum]|uniref:Uncharacterized protein n=1 Tax=Dactylosporangium sucinum TaxID=1424081 RepID=A0A917TT72_9ACTN|nr:hypothetical protein [Dactylosporangium sucinum]GGM37037.1 hypothetical protein GCM10007977_043090 [Dactylosporangium sucinum]
MDALTDAKYVVGLDLGDGESTIAWQAIDGDAPIEVYQRPNGEVGVLSALATKPPVGRVVGVDAVATPGVVHFSVNFKRRPNAKEVKSPPYVVFARTLLNEFFAKHRDIQSQCVVYIGHPSGWSTHSVELYRGYLDQLGDKGALIQVVSEAHSALVHASDRQTGQLPQYDRTVLVVDIGSSTTDLTLVSAGEPRNLPLGADLGCAAIDRAIAAQLAVLAAGPSFDQALASDGGEDFLRLVARRIKEGSFLGWKAHVRSLAGGDQRWQPLIDGALKVARRVDQRAIVKQWADQFRAMLHQARLEYVHTPPDQIILTGGGSRMRFTRDICAEVFSGSRVDNDREPQLSVARGLVANGRYRIRVARFRDDIGAILKRPELDEVLNGEVVNAFQAIRSAMAEKAMTDEDVLVAAFLSGTSGDASEASYTRRLVGQLLEQRVHQITRNLVPECQRVCRQHGIPSDFEITLPELHDVVYSELARALLAPLGAVGDHGRDITIPSIPQTGVDALGKTASRVLTSRLSGNVEIGRFARVTGNVDKAVLAGVVLAYAGMATVKGALWVHEKVRQSRARRKLRDAILAMELTAGSRQAIIARVRTAVALPLERKAQEVERALA